MPQNDMKNAAEAGQATLGIWLITLVLNGMEHYLAVIEIDKILDLDT